MNPARASRLVLMIVTLCALLPNSFAQITLGPWHIRHPHPTDWSRALVHDGQKFVLAGSHGNIFTSIPAHNWTAQPTPIQRALNSLVYGSNTFIAVGKGGTILTSTDATNWVSLQSPTTNDLRKIIFTGEHFVAVGDNGTIISSPFRGEFILHTPIATNLLRDVTGGAGTLVAAGDQATILVSTHLGEWKRATVTATNDFWSIAYFKGAFHNGWHSTGDPMLWTNTIPYNPRFTIVYSLATNSQMIARSMGGYIQYSPSGTFLSPATNVPGRLPLTTISNRFVTLGSAVSFQEATGFVRKTPEFLPARFRWIAADTNGYVGFSSSSEYAHYFTSTNAQSWQRTPVKELTVRTNDLAFATPPFARARAIHPFNSWLEINDGKGWQSIQHPARDVQHAAAIGDIIVASGVQDLWVSTNLWPATNRFHWKTVMSKIGPIDYSYGQVEGSYYRTHPWVTSISTKSNLLVATTIYGELLLTTNGLDWQIEQTPFETLEDATFTPSGLLVSSYNTIAETYFDNAPDSLMPSSFTASTNQVIFDGPLLRTPILTRFHKLGHFPNHEHQHGLQVLPLQLPRLLSRSRSALS
ncbi:MAG TPA: hypothetical protein VF773_18535 [Verrucomicrobiae bacterium]